MQPVQRTPCQGGASPPPDFAGCLARMSDEQAWADAAPAIIGKNASRGGSVGGPGRGAGSGNSGGGYAGGDAPG